MDPADFVLRDFPAADRAELDLVIAEAVDAVTRLVTDGMERARGVVNSAG